MQAIRFQNVRFSYEENANNEGAQDVFSMDNTFALNGINFSVAEGEFVAVLGHNGSGKSTLARLTNGLLSPSEGEIEVLGLNARDEKNLFEIRKQVGIVFQNPDNQTVASIVEDDIAFGPENIGVPREEIAKRIDFALNAVGMQAFRTATPARLSGGQKQRVAIAGVLALKPKIMILDESTAMLDPRGRKEVMDVVVRLNKEENITVLLITHFPEEAMLADRAVVMSHGKIVMEGKPEEILSKDEELKKYALMPPRSIRIGNALTKGGLSVSTSLDVQSLAERIASALRERGVENNAKNAELFKTAWAGTRSTEDTSELGGGGGVYCRNLSYVYNPSQPFETHALNGADLEIQSGDFFGIIGHTGSGKSTFVQHLNALLKTPMAEKNYKPKKLKKGENPPAPVVLRVDGFDLTDKNTDFRALRSKVGMVFQYPEYQLFAETVFEDVAFGLKNFFPNTTPAQTEQAVREALETVGLCYEEIKDKSPFELSGGQKRRVAIAGVIVTRPEILVLDEPAAGLDPLGKEEIMQLLHKLHHDWCKTVVFVSHDMDEIAENCTRAAIFSEGKVAAVATPKELFADREKMFALGLDVPFTAKLVQKLQNEYAISCDYTLDGFVSATLALLKTKGTGTRSLERGQEK